jgi:hypothetical protein
MGRPTTEVEGFWDRPLTNCLNCCGNSGRADNTASPTRVNSVPCYRTRRWKAAAVYATAPIVLDCNGISCGDLSLCRAGREVYRPHALL